MRIALLSLAVFLIFTLCPCQAQTYTNKDIEQLKTEQKSTPGYNSAKKAPAAKTAPAGKGASRPPHKAAPAKAKNPGGINYSSPESTVKIKVKSNKTASGKKYPKASAKKTKPAAEGKPAEITVLPNLAVIERMLPYEDWKEEYQDYFLRHYKDDTLTLDPRFIVIRSTGVRSADDVLNLFRRGSLYDEGDEGQIFGHLSCHYIIDYNGEMIQALPLTVRSKGAYGVNHKAITIELAGRSNQELLNNENQKKSLYALIEALTRTFHIPIARVYGHHEVAQGRSIVPEYTEFNDSDYPDAYSPVNICYDPGQMYMQQMKDHFAKQTSKGQ